MTRQILACVKSIDSKLCWILMETARFQFWRIDGQSLGIDFV